MKSVNWYFEGWKKNKETDDSGHTKTTWVYSGVKYRFQVEDTYVTHLKFGYIGMTAAMTVLWLVFSFVTCSGREKAAYAGAPWFIMIIPLMYLYMGVYGLIRSKSVMTYRDVRAGYYRIRYAKWALLVLQIIALAGEIIYLSINSHEIMISQELIWMAGICGCIACSIGIIILQNKFPPYQIPGDN